MGYGVTCPFLQRRSERKVLSIDKYYCLTYGFDAHNCGDCHAGTDGRIVLRLTCRVGRWFVTTDRRVHRFHAEASCKLCDTVVTGW